MYIRVNYMKWHTAMDMWIKKSKEQKTKIVPKQRNI